jgi:hypothetical protein
VTVSRNTPGSAAQQADLPGAAVSSVTVIGTNVPLNRSTVS